jgi:DNA mismatch repair protein MutS2
MNLKGSVMSLPDAKGNLQVRMGILHSQVNVKDLELVDEVDISTPHMNRTSSGRVSLAKSATISPEINLLGKTVKKEPAACPPEAHEYAVKQLEALRAAGKAPKPQA